MTGNLRVDDILAMFPGPELLSQEGGQKIVYTIAHAQFGRCVLKIGLYGSTTVLTRIRREVEVLRGINSPYFPRNLDFQVVDNSRYYIIEEFLDGTTLEHCMDQFQAPVAALGLGAELVKALRLLWDQRIVHRDVKPQNIIISSGGPRVIDLGIARLLDATSLTSTHAAFGPRTPAYASPEQLENRKRDIDHRSDQFNLGLVLAQLMLRGIHPFDGAFLGNGKSIVENIIEGNWGHQALAEMVRPGVLGLVERLLKREPYQRFRTPDDLEAAIIQAEGGLI